MPRPTDSLSMFKARAGSVRPMHPRTSVASRRDMLPPGSARSRPRPFPNGIVGAAAALLVLTAHTQAADDEALQPHRVVDDAIPESLTGTTGDPAAGRAIVVDRRLGACRFCHTSPFAEGGVQRNIA